MSYVLNPPPGSAPAVELDNLPCKVVLPVRAGMMPSNKPVVRIFLGSEDGQYRAERVFFFAVEKVRDPTRVYEIHVMKNMAGLVRKGWRTGFTNYRFAIPDYAGRQGRAIYNDVDQIYLADPARLFDLDMNGHGYLSVSANDTSVMVLDCARMGRWWNLAGARAGSKAQLLDQVKGEPGVWGALDPGWNARDAEYVPGRSMLLHFTAMHTQPWRPFPRDYSYHPHPLADLWLALEREADAVGYQVFTRASPSPAYELARRRTYEARSPVASLRLSDRAQAFVRSLAPRSLLVAGLWRPVPPPDGPAATTTVLDVAADQAWPDAPSNLTIAADLLERLPPDDVPWLLDELFRLSDKGVLVRVNCHAADKLLCNRAPEWWREMMQAAAVRRPGLVWRLEAVLDGGKTVAFESPPASTAPATTRVWALVGPRAGDRAQVLALAESLGWPTEVKELRYNRLHHLPNILLGPTSASIDRDRSSPLAPPWPDLVIDCGKRSVPIARWIKRASGGHARIVHLGRPWAPFDAFDLIVTTPQYRLLERPNVLANLMPLIRLPKETLKSAATTWEPKLAHLPRPWVALIVGGDSTTHCLDADTATRLGREANALAGGAGGSLLVTTSGRTRPQAAEALMRSITVPAHLHRWQANGADNPYLAYLALADSFVVTGDSASMIAEACAMERPVAVFALPRTPRPLARLAARLADWALGHRRHRNYRGMPMQQDWLSRGIDRLIERGVFMPARDLDLYQQTLRDRGLIRSLGEPVLPSAPRPADELCHTVARVRALMTQARRAD